MNFCQNNEEQMWFGNRFAAGSILLPGPTIPYNTVDENVCSQFYANAGLHFLPMATKQVHSTMEIHSVRSHLPISGIMTLNPTMPGDTVGVLQSMWLTQGWMMRAASSFRIIGSPRRQASLPASSLQLTLMASTGLRKLDSPLRPQLLAL